MQLEHVQTLPQGTPLFEVETGYKDCRCPGSYFARQHAGKIVCPGCARVCQMYAMDIKPGDHFSVRKRPAKKQRSR